MPQGLGRTGGPQFKSQVNATKRRPASGSSESPSGRSLVNGTPRYLGQPGPGPADFSRGEFGLDGKKRRRLKGAD